MKTKRQILLVCILFMVVSVGAIAYPPPSYSKFDFVFNQMSGDWDVATNWNHYNYDGTYVLEGPWTVVPGQPTTSGNHAILDNGGTINISSTPVNALPSYINLGYTTTGNTVNHTAGDMTASYLYLVSIGMESGGDGTYNLSGGTLKATPQLGYTTGSTGAMNVSGGTFQAPEMTVGYYGTGVYTQTGGTVMSNNIYVGRMTSGIGTFNLNGGTLGVYYSTLNVNVGSSGTGEFNQGISYSATTLKVGVNATGDGTYNLNAGTLTMKTAVIGGAGTGVFEHNAGSAVYNKAGTTLAYVTNLIIGDADGSDGTYNLKGGNLSMTGAYSAIVIGNEAGASGVLNIDGGTLSMTNSAALIVGGAGAGVVNQDSGTVTSSTVSAFIIHVGYEEGGTGTYNYDGGTMTKVRLNIGEAGTGYFYQNGTDISGSYVNLGIEETGVGTYTMTAGSSLTLSRFLSVGEAGTGTFNQNGGTVAASSIIIGSGKGQGVYNFTGGALDVTGDLIVGKDTNAMGDAVFNQVGGDVHVGGDLHISYRDYNTFGPADGYGTYNMEGGFLAVDGNIYVGGGATADIGNNAGIMNLKGGEIAVTNFYITNEDGYVSDKDATCGSGVTLMVLGEFINSSTANGDFDMARTTLIMAGGGTGWVDDVPGVSAGYWDYVSIDMGDVVDMGNNLLGLVDNFAIGDLVFKGADTGSIWYMLESDIYCYGLRIEDGVAVVLNDYTIYYMPENAASYNGSKPTTTHYINESSVIYWLEGELVELDAPIEEPVIPEPGTIVLIGTGVLGLAAVLRKKYC